MSHIARKFTPPPPSLWGVRACVRACVTLCRSSATQTAATSRRGYEISCFAEMRASVRLRLGGRGFPPQRRTCSRAQAGCVYRKDVDGSVHAAHRGGVGVGGGGRAGGETREKPDYHSGITAGSWRLQQPERNWSRGTSLLLMLDTAGQEGPGVDAPAGTRPSPDPCSSSRLHHLTEKKSFRGNGQEAVGAWFPWQRAA